MPEWINSIGTFLVELIPELILTIFTGVTILAIEYWTGWFADHTSVITKGSDEDGGVTRVGKSIKPIINAIVQGIGILLALLLLATFFYFLIDDPQQTVLDNPDDSSIVVGKIASGDTLSFFNNSIFITVNNSYGSQSTHFTVGAPGYPDQVEERRPIGYSIIYQTTSSYHIKITSVSTGFSGTIIDFTVTDLGEGEIFITPIPLVDP